MGMGVAMGVASRGARRSGERALRVPLECSDPASYSIYIDVVKRRSRVLRRRTRQAALDKPRVHDGQ